MPNEEDHASMGPILETERLLLRQFVPGDAEELFRLHSDLEVLRYTGDTAPADIEEARRLLAARQIADYERYGFGRWVCMLKATGSFVGWAGLKYLPELGEVDLGYRLRRDWWGRGLATEAARGCVEYGFAMLSLPRIIGVVEPAHAASIRVLEKAGFHRDGEMTYRGSAVLRYVRLRGAARVEGAAPRDID
ncbi:MAG TPA: GNAT family N-acetyltransferase [Pirellulales bacterium]|nr:GNAT family N-acetyltransferase [Pirellulales bacterium]